MSSLAVPHHEPARPLLVTSDEALLDDLLRLAALAGTEPHVARDPVAARTYWGTAPLVVVGAELAPECVRARLPRRHGVALVASVQPSSEGVPPSGSGVPPSGGGVPPEPMWALASELGADQVLTLPDAEAWLVRRLAESLGGGGSARLVAVVPGSGGAGASVLAAGLAVTAVRQHVRPMLVDADPYGGGMDVLLGWEDRDGLRWPQLADAGGAMSVDGLYGSLPHHGDLVLLSWDRTDTYRVPVGAVDAVLDAGRRGSDLVIVDLPRRVDEATVRVLQAADLVLLVARPDVRSCAAAVHTSRLLR
ncbi:MAG: septum site-determining protein Ssd, partial [Micromonosporaceae bacterium]